MYFFCKDDQNGPIHPEHSRIIFFIIGGVRSNFRADSPILFLFNFILFLWSYLLKYGEGQALSGKINKIVKYAVSSNSARTLKKKLLSAIF